MKVYYKSFRSRLGDRIVLRIIAHIQCFGNGPPKSEAHYLFIQSLYMFSSDKTRRLELAVSSAQKRMK
jgi:hypothetical protein